MIITLDGPVASGKSTVARLLAEQLEYQYLNTGLMFRAVAYLLYIKSNSLNLTDLIYTYSKKNGAQILYKDSNITHLLKTPEMDQLSSQVATQPEVRAVLLSYQQQLGLNNNVVAEGRDTGTVVFPNADHKFFITANPEIRAERWKHFQEQQGKVYSLEESLEIIKERDLRDSEREIAPLVIPQEAHTIDTTTMSIEQAVARCSAIIKA